MLRPPPPPPAPRVPRFAHNATVRLSVGCCAVLPSASTNPPPQPRPLAPPCSSVHKSSDRHHNSQHHNSQHHLCAALHFTVSFTPRRPHLRTVAIITHSQTHKDPPDTPDRQTDRHRTRAHNTKRQQTLTWLGFLRWPLRVSGSSSWPDEWRRQW